MHGDQAIIINNCQILRRFDEWTNNLTDYCRHFDCLLSPFWPMTVAVLTEILRRFDQWLSPFWPMLVAVLTNGCRRFDSSCRRFDSSCRRFGVSPFWHVAVFVVAVPTCRRYDRYPSLLLLLLLPIQVQGSVFRRIIALWGSGSLEWVVESRDRRDRRLFSVSSERHWQGGVNGIAKVPKRSYRSGIRTRPGNRPVAGPSQRSNPLGHRAPLLPMAILWTLKLEYYTQGYF